MKEFKKRLKPNSFRKLFHKITKLYKDSPQMLPLSLLVMGILIFSGVAISQMSVDNQIYNIETTPTPFIKNEDDEKYLENKLDISSSVTPTLITTKKVTVTPTKTTTVANTPTVTSAPTNTTTPTITPIPTPTPTPEGTCSIWSDVSEGNAPLNVQFAYQASYVDGNNSVVAVQWDFTGDGTWDTDMAYEEVNRRPTYEYTQGTHTVKMQLKLQSGYITSVCTRQIKAL